MNEKQKEQTKKPDKPWDTFKFGRDCYCCMWLQGQSASSNFGSSSFRTGASGKDPEGFGSKGARIEHVCDAHEGEVREPPDKTELKCNNDTEESKV